MSVFNNNDSAAVPPFVPRVGLASKVANGVVLVNTSVIRTKISFGIILTRRNAASGQQEAMLERDRYSYEFSEFVHGRYSRKNVRAVVALIGGMSINERLDIYSLDFTQIWYRIWLTADRHELFHKKFSKFHSSWMRDDGGTFLRSLIQGGAGACMSPPPPERWGFPKGRRQSNRESDISCAIREFEEETGIPKRDYQILSGIKRRSVHIHMGVRYVQVFYVAMVRRHLMPVVDLRRLDQAAEIAELRWLNIAQIRLLDYPNTSRLEALARPAFRYVKNYLRGTGSNIAVTAINTAATISTISTPLRMPFNNLRCAGPLYSLKGIDATVNKNTKYVRNSRVPLSGIADGNWREVLTRREKRHV
jgi:8-oxo-dGTP pyrophosphatase MutT (NUDIX family)